MRTSRTKIRRKSGKLIADLPLYVLPEVRKQIIRVFEPAIEVQSVDYLPLRTGAMEKDTGRIPVHIPPWMLNQLGIDATRRIKLRLYRHPVWFQSHLYHGWGSGRAWLPREAINRFNLQPHTQYSFQIRGWTPELEKERLEEILEIRINHLNIEYPTNTRTWVIPEVTGRFMGRAIEPEVLLGWAVDEGYDVIAEWYYDEIPGFISVDFIVEPNNPSATKYVARRNNIAFRTMSLRNYTATVELDYGFLAEIRCTHLDCYPRSFYNLDNSYMTLLDAERITIENILNFWFQFKGEGSHLRYAEKQGKVKYEVTGEEDTVPVSYGEIADFIFGYADKYVRILAHNDEYEYFNERLEHDLHGKQFEDGAMLVVDRNGFIWLRR